MSPRNAIKVEFDEMTQNYYIIWQPIIMGMGETRGEAHWRLKRGCPLLRGYLY